MGTTRSTQDLLYRPKFENCEPRLLMATDAVGEIPIGQFSGSESGDRQIAMFAEPGQYVPTMMDPWMPNPVYGSTFRSALGGGTGLWSDASTWSAGRAPMAGDRVIIAAGDEVLIQDTGAIAHSIGVYEGGKLRFATNVNTELKVVTLLVLGELEIGTAANPIDAGVTATLTIRDVPFDFQEDPGQYGHGLVATQNAKVRIHGRALSETFVRLASEPRAGDTTLVMENGVTGWRVGDQILIPDTRQLRSSQNPWLGGTYNPEWEELTIANISGTTITLSSPLTFDHLGARDGDGILDFLPHVVNRTRNVVIQSENPNGVRGHTLYGNRSDIDIRYAQFKDMGRTKNLALDNTTFDENGNATHIGTNQIARYAVHTHHLIGPTSAQSNGYQFTLVGNSIDGGTQDNNQKWAITIHGSHYGLIQANVVYNISGGGIVTEDGNESFNVFDGNFVMRSKSIGSGWRISGSEKNPDGRSATGFWFRGLNNYIRNNVATNILSYDEAETGYGYKFLNNFVGDKTIPAFQGANPNENGVTVNMYETAIPQFENNEAYGAIESALTYWWIGTHYQTPEPDAGTTVIKDFKVWHTFGAGIYHYPSANVLLDGLVMRGDGSGTKTNVGLMFGDYMAQDVIIRDADIQGFGAGIKLTEFGIGATVIENSFLRTKFRNIEVETHRSTSGTHVLKAKSAIIRNVRFDSWGSEATVNIKTDYVSLSYEKSDVILLDEIFVYDYNGVSGDDFQVFYLEQAPDFIVPQSTSLSVGSPEAGLTNQQNWDTYGIAIAGAVAPTTATRAGIDGFVLTLSTPAPTAPTGVTASPVSSTRIDLSWNDVSGEDGYRIYQWMGSESQMVGSVGANQTSFSVTGLSPGQSYSFTVEAYNGAGSAFSSWQSADTLFAAPTQIGSVTAAGVSASQIDLSWNDVSGEDGYRIYQWMGSGSQMVGSVGANQTSFSVTGLSPAQTYSFTVGAHNGAGSTWSSWQSAETLSATPTQIGSVTAIGVSASQIDLSWSDVQYETEYRVYQWTSGGSQLIGTAGADATSYSVTGLSTQQTYWFTIGAYNSAGSTWSSWQSAETLLAPTPMGSVTATGVSASQIDLSWSDVQYETEYRIYQWTGSGSQMIGTTGANVTSFSVTGLSSQQTYWFTIGAHNGAGSTWSSWSSATTLAAAKTGRSELSEEGGQLLDVVALKKLLGKATEQALGESIDTTKEKGLPLLARAVDDAMEHIKALSTMVGGDESDVPELRSPEDDDVEAHREIVDRLHETSRSFA
ncbi:MAG: fibronectin type III domain-containing protein [Planctomycetes bacterium]|nr:fibronectin type III domain-containing protein [Planctomycetota bacterium]